MRKETIKWSPVIRVEKFHDVTEVAAALGRNLTVEDVHRLRREGVLRPDDVVEVEGNALVTAGRQRLSDLITGSGQAFTTTRGMIGVGNGNAATTAGMTALQGASQLYKAIDGAPGSSSGVITAAATFLAGEASFAWEEWCMAVAAAAPVTNSSFNTATSSGVMLNRKAEALGTKGSTAVWTLSVTATIS